MAAFAASVRALCLSEALLLGQHVLEPYRPRACSGLGSQSQLSAVELGNSGQTGPKPKAGSWSSPASVL